MNITKEELIQARDRKKNVINKLNAFFKKAVYFYIAEIAAILIFCIISYVSNNKSFLYAAIAAGIVFIISFGVSMKYIWNISIKYDHYVGSKEMIELLKKLQREYFSNDFMSWAINVLSKENDILCRGILRDILVEGNIFRGEFDIAIRAIFPDGKLFLKDRVFELIYLKNLLSYHCSVNADMYLIEEDYRRINELFFSGQIERSDYKTLICALSCELEYAQIHSDWERTLYYADIMSFAYDNLSNADLYGMRIEYASLMIIKAKALYRLGKADDAKALADEWSEYLRPFPYQYNNARRLLKMIS